VRAAQGEADHEHLHDEGEDELQQQRLDAPSRRARSRARPAARGERGECADVDREEGRVRGRALRGRQPASV